MQAHAYIHRYAYVAAGECVGKPVKYLSFQQTARVLATIRISGALRRCTYVVWICTSMYMCL